MLYFTTTLVLVMIFCDVYKLASLHLKIFSNEILKYNWDIFCHWIVTQFPNTHHVGLLNIYFLFFYSTLKYPRDIVCYCCYVCLFFVINIVTNTNITCQFLRFPEYYYKCLLRQIFLELTNITSFTLNFRNYSFKGSL